MFVRLLVRSLLVRKGRSLIAISALTMLAAVATALLTLSMDIRAKLTQEFRRFGTNVIVTQQGGAFSAAQLEALRQQLSPADEELDEAVLIARTENQRPVLVVGTDLRRAAGMNPWWRLTGEPRSAVVGAEEQRKLAESGEAILTYAGKAFHLPAERAVLHTGDATEKQILLPLPVIEQTFSQPMNRVELALSGTTEEVAAKISRIRLALPGVETQPVRQIVEAEGRVVERSRRALLYATIIIGLAVALCVLATLMSSVLERRRDYAVMKALGSSQRTVLALFLAEALVMAVLSYVIGCGAGLGIASLIGYMNFHSSVALHWVALPIVLVGTLSVALVSSIIPMMRLQRIEPAMILKGD